jgi:hypothetical protein
MIRGAQAVGRRQGLVFRGRTTIPTKILRDWIKLAVKLRVPRTRGIS